MMEMYRIVDVASKGTKSKWKSIVKEKIRKGTENKIRTECEGMSKGRTVINDEYVIKPYFKETTLKKTSQFFFIYSRLVHTYRTKNIT